MWSSSVGQAHGRLGWAFHPLMGTPLRKRSLDAERERGGPCEDGDGKERDIATSLGNHHLPSPEARKRPRYRGSPEFLREREGPVKFPV